MTTRLTVLYNLPDGADEEEFLEWRLTEHQTHNASMPNVARTDFALIRESWPESAATRFRFQTNVDWPDRETFEASFFADSVQAKLEENLKKLGDYTFFVSEVLAETVSENA